MLRLAFAASLALAACASGDSVPPSAPAAAAPAGQPTEPAPLVVAELFTSEGCSSCPPADRLLARLANDVEVLALSYHVDYWDRLGWADRFGSPEWSARQRAYARTLDGRVYTPQLVIGGDAGVVGSQARDVQAALDEAERDTQPARIELRPELDGRTVRVDYAVEGEALGESARLHVLLVQRAGRSYVLRGENRGRHLDHAHIVRAADTREPGTGTAELAMIGGLDADDVFVAALVQTARVGRILGAARADVSVAP